jgi:hypothetical protein
MDIFIHGKAYKPGVPYVDGSYSLLIGHYVEVLGKPVNYIDPLTGDINAPDQSAVFLLAHSPSTTYKYMAEEGDGTDRMYCNIPAGSVVVDPWRKFTSDSSEVVYYGNTR